MRSFKRWIAVPISCAVLLNCSKPFILEKENMEYVEKQLQKLSPVTLTHDLSYLPPAEVRVIKLLVQASKIMDGLRTNLPQGTMHQLLILMLKNHEHLLVYNSK